VAVSALGAATVLAAASAQGNVVGYRGSIGAGNTFMDGEETVVRATAGIVLSDWQVLGFAVSPHLDAGLLLWLPHQGRGDNVTGGSLRVTLAHAVSDGSPWFWEVGTGMLLLSDRQLRNDLDMGTRWHFDSHVGLGRHFGPAARWSLIYQVHHASNGGATEQNPGVNFQLVNLVYRY